MCEAHIIQKEPKKGINVWRAHEGYTWALDYYMNGAMHETQCTKTQQKKDKLYGLKYIVIH